MRSYNSSLQIEDDHNDVGVIFDLCVHNVGFDPGDVGHSLSRVLSALGVDEVLAVGLLRRVVFVTLRDVPMSLHALVHRQSGHRLC